MLWGVCSFSSKNMHNSHLHTKLFKYSLIFSFQFSSVAQSRLTLCNRVDCSTPRLPVHRQFPELTQTHVHGVGDATQPSYPLSSPYLPTFNIAPHQDLFKWVNSSKASILWHSHIFIVQLFLYSPTLTSIPHHWKNHSLD